MIPEENPLMTIDTAEQVLNKALTAYVQNNPAEKKEIQAALDELLDKTGKATSIASECQKALQTCLTIINSCPYAILRTS